MGNESRMVEDNIKAIYGATEWNDRAITMTGLAEHLGVAVSTASENISKLVAQGLVKHEPYRGVSLTAEGQRLALKMVRKHRLIETYLHQRLNYTWDEVHEEAEILEHAASDRLIDHMDADLGYPEADPHGDPIPRLDGTVPMPQVRELATLEVGESATVVRINDDSPELLRFLETTAGVLPGVRLTVLEVLSEAGVTVLQVGEKKVSLGIPAVASIWVDCPRS